MELGDIPVILFFLHFRERHRQGIKRGQPPKNLSRPRPYCIVAKQLNKYSIYVFGKILQAFFNSFSLSFSRCGAVKIRPQLFLIDTGDLFKPRKRENTVFHIIYKDAFDIVFI